MKELYYLFHKEEEFGVKTGERRAIRVATSKHLEGPYQIVEGNLNEWADRAGYHRRSYCYTGSVNSGWLLFYDYCMTNRYGVSYSTDLLNWKMEEDVNFPADARHGCVSKITAKEARVFN